MKTLKIVWAWIVKSSADPRKVSLTVKGLVGTAVLLLGYLGVTGHELNAEQIGDNVADIIVQIATAGTALIALYGAARKIWLSFKG